MNTEKYANWEAACKNEAKNASKHQAKSIDLQLRIDELEEALKEIMLMDINSIHRDPQAIARAVLTHRNVVKLHKNGGANA